jgi:hypothetical protein
MGENGLSLLNLKGKWVYLYRAVDSTGATEIKSSEFGDKIIAHIA